MRTVSGALTDVTGPAEQGGCSLASFSRVSWRSQLNETPWPEALALETQKRQKNFVQCMKTHYVSTWGHKEGRLPVTRKAFTAWTGPEAALSLVSLLVVLSEAAVSIKVNCSTSSRICRAPLHMQMKHNTLSMTRRRRLAVLRCVHAALLCWHALLRRSTIKR
ncbi:hypothetical protein TRVL_09142 [Trypanosoma vivax]|nr:hypothetical protein TRVL_09142 [Trypanosoma vivax]